MPAKGVAGSGVSVPVDSEDLAERGREVTGPLRSFTVADRHVDALGSDLTRTDLVRYRGEVAAEEPGEDHLAGGRAGEMPRPRLETSHAVPQHAGGLVVRICGEHVASRRIDAEAGETCLRLRLRQGVARLGHHARGERVHVAVVRHDLDRPAQLGHEVQRVVRRGARLRDEGDGGGELVTLGVDVQREVLRQSPVPAPGSRLFRLFFAVARCEDRRRDARGCEQNQERQCYTQFHSRTFSDLASRRRLS